MTELTILPMAREHLDLAIDWAAAEGWNPGRHDADAFWAADPGGFSVACLGDEPVATISVVRYGADFAFVGLYIVAPEHRGRGYGIALWDHALAAVPGRCLGLDGVVEQRRAYERSGFALSWRNVRHELTHPSTLNPDGRTTDLSAIPLAAIVADDRRTFPAERSGFLATWLTRPGTVGRAVVDDGQLRGWGVRRPCRIGTKIGPLLADSPAVADALFRDLASDVDGPVILDVPESNPEAVALVERYAMPARFETVRMYRGTPPVVDHDRIFGITTFELG